ncbi:hypothetical protein C350_06494 [Cryptococcus neoformans MW-RSA36]|nr:hypothetical protein C350_06494 [Cryptococcus neoformans var. grubii MW-RSA36]
MPRFSRKQEVLREIDNLSSFGDVENTKTTFTPSPDEDKKVIAALHMSGAEIRRLIALLRRSQSFRGTWVEVTDAARGVASDAHLQKGRRLEGMIVEDLYNQTEHTRCGLLGRMWLYRRPS